MLIPKFGQMLDIKGVRYQVIHLMPKNKKCIVVPIGIDNIKIKTQKKIMHFADLVMSLEKKEAK